MKIIMAAIAFMFVLSTSAGIASAHDGEREGYEQHESKDHGDKDRNEHGDKDRDRGERHAPDYEKVHQGPATESGGHFWDWLPF